MSVVDEIKTLRARRFEHEAAIREIDAQLEDVRELLGQTPVNDDAPTLPRKGRTRGMPMRVSDPNHLTRTERQILDSLATIQPQTVKMLDSRIDVQSCGLNMKPLLDRGFVVRRVWKMKSEERYSKYPYWYALHVEALDRMEAQLRVSGQLREEVKPDEAPPDPRSPSEEAASSFTDGTLLATATNSIAPIIEATSPPSVRSNGSLGSEK